MTDDERIRDVANAPQQTSEAPIATRPRPTCLLCGHEGVLLYRDLRDRMYAAPGVWSLRRCPAAACGLVWLDPIPTEESVRKVYETYYTHESPAAPRSGPFLGVLRTARRAYLHERLGYLPERSGRDRHLGRAVAALVRMLPGGRAALEDTACHLPAPAPGARLLEVGFGNGAQLSRMRALGWSVVGVEYDPVAVTAAGERGLDVQLGDLQSAEFSGGTFDAVYMSHVIEHVHAPLDLLRECHRVLKPGGTLVVVTPNIGSLGHERFDASWLHLDPPRHLTLFSPATLRSVAGRAGFSEPELKTWPRIAFLSWLGSVEIRTRGRVVFVDRRFPLRRLVQAAAFQVAEAAIMLVRPAAGEELFLVATKRR